MIDFTALTFVDYAVFLVLIVSAVFSTLRGMTREFLGLAGWVVSVLIANFTKPVLEGPITDIIEAERLSAALAWALPFAASVIIWFLLASLLSPGLTRAGLGSLDRWFGVIFGFIRGYFLVLLAFVGAVIALEGETKLPTTIKDAQSTPIFSQGARFFSAFVPEDYRDQLLSNLVVHDTDTMPQSSRIDSVLETGGEIIKKPLELLGDEKTN
jgi:membrane protein required for colicin V production